MNYLIRAMGLSLVAIPLWSLTQVESLADDTAAVASRVESYVAAFNARDAEACARHWSENAEYVFSQSGARLQGRQAIHEELERLLNTDENFELRVAVQRFRQVSDDVVLEEGTATVASASHGNEQARYVVVHVKRDETWYRDSVRETSLATPIATHSQLHELAWLIGRWRAEDDQGSVEVDGQWINDQRFIRRSFKVRGSEGYQFEGIQIVGWDPAGGVIRSWSFDSEGGYEQAVWTRHDQHWLVQVSAVLPDGSTGSEQRRMSFDGDSQKSEVIEQQIDGQLMPGSASVTFVRQRDSGQN